MDQELVENSRKFQLLLFTHCQIPFEGHKVFAYQTDTDLLNGLGT